jgi:hypothetical protein
MGAEEAEGGVARLGASESAGIFEREAGSKLGRRT